MARVRTPPTALLIRRGEELELLFPDSTTATDAIRRTVGAKLRPKPSRVVDYRTRTLDPTAFEATVRVLKDYGYRVESYTQGTTAPKARSLSDRAVLGVTEAAPWPVIEAAYRALSRMFHPDVAGATMANTRRMQEINLAYERLGRESRHR